MLPGNQVLKSFVFQQFKAFGQIFFRTRGRSWGSVGKRRRANATWFRPRFSTAKSLEGWDVAIVMTSLNLFFEDFEDFDIANEDDVLEEFLGLERSKPKVPQLKWEKGGFNLCKETLYTCQQWKSWEPQIAPVKTGAVAPEVNKLKVGKLEVKEEAKSSKEKDEVFDETFVFLLCISSYLSLLFFHLFSFRYIVFSSISLFLMKNGQAESRNR